jgi:hypothetical protein
MKITKIEVTSVASFENERREFENNLLEKKKAPSSF